MKANAKPSPLKTLLNVFWLLSVCLALSGRSLAQEPAIFINPLTSQPDADGIIRFSVAVTGVSAPGFRSYALKLTFAGSNFNLVDEINTLNNLPPADQVICSAVLNLGPVQETVVPNVLTLLQSGQGQFVLDSLDGGTLLCTENRIIDPDMGLYNCGIAGAGAGNPQTGDGSLIDFRCLAGDSVPQPTVITVTPGLFPNLAGAIFLDESGRAPIIDTFQSGRIVIGEPPPPPPEIITPLCKGDTVIQGTSTEVDGTEIKVFINDTEVGTTNVSSGTWALGDLDPPLAEGDKVKATAKAPGELESTLSSEVIVEKCQRPPMLDFVPPPPRVVCVGQELTFKVSSTDPDGDNVAIIVGNLPTGASFIDNGDGTGDFIWMPTEFQVGSYPDITFTATDDGNPITSVWEMIDITVKNCNLSPKLSIIGNRRAQEGRTITIHLSAMDFDNNNMSFSVGNPPSGAELVDHGNGMATFSWTPSIDQLGDFPVTFIVTDDGDPPKSDSEDITITVGDGNQPPELNPIGSHTVQPGEPLTLFLIASDPEDNTLSYAAGNLPPGATLMDNGDGTAEFHWMPSMDHIGNHRVTFIVTDDGDPWGSDWEEIVITVGPVNRPPVLDPIGNRSVAVDEEVLIPLTGNDPHGDNLSYAVADNPPGSRLKDQRNGTAEFSWARRVELGNHRLSFSVTDDGVPEESDWEDIIISVGPVNRPPALAPIGDRRVMPDNPLIIQLTATDPEGDQLIFQVLDLPPGASFVDNNNGTAQLSWTPSLEQIGYYRLTVIVSDDNDPAHSAAEAVAITVGDPKHFLCYKTRESRANICRQGSPQNEGGICTSELDCGGNETTEFCIKNKFPKNPPPLLLEDQLEAGYFDLKRPLALCTPANKNGENPTAPEQPLHLKAYQIKEAKVCSDTELPCQNTKACNPGAVCRPLKHERVSNLRVDDQFGTLLVDTIKPDSLFVPTAKDRDMPIAAPTDGEHFKCYTVRVQKNICERDPELRCRSDADCALVGGRCNRGFPSGLQARVDDQFPDTPALVDIKKPSNLCTPVNKENEDPEAKDRFGHLMCYQVKRVRKLCAANAPWNPLRECRREEDCGGVTRGENKTALCEVQPNHARFERIHVNNQLGPELLDTIKEDELCLPAQKRVLGVTP